MQHEIPYSIVDSFVLGRILFVCINALLFELELDESGRLICHMDIADRFREVAIQSLSVGRMFQRSWMLNLPDTFGSHIVHTGG